MAIQVVSFHCVLKDNLGRIISSTINQSIMTEKKTVGTSAILAELLRDIRNGEKRQIYLRAEQAYGYYDPKLVLTRRHDDLSIGDAPMRIGERVIYKSGGKQGVFRVTQVTQDTVTLDGNHPLAGQDLFFEVEAIETRDATREELESHRHQSLDPSYH